MRHHDVTIGSLGRTRAALRPSGQVVIAETVYEASADSGWIDADVQVAVLRVEPFGLIVAEATEQEAAALVEAEELRARQQQALVDADRREQRRRRRRDLLAGGVLGCFLAIALLFWLDHKHERSIRWLDLAFPLVGMLAGVLNVISFRVFYQVVREEISDRWPTEPTWTLRITYPWIGSVVGAIIGGAIASAMGATIGTIVGGFLFTPLALALFVIFGSFCT